MLGSYQRQVVRYVRKFDIDDSDENNVSVSYSEDQDVSREDCDDKGSLIWLNKPVAKSYELNSQLSIEQKMMIQVWAIGTIISSTRMETKVQHMICLL